MEYATASVRIQYTTRTVGNSRPIGSGSALPRRMPVPRVWLGDDLLLEIVQKAATIGGKSTHST
jgi:hypothetical protein